MKEFKWNVEPNGRLFWDLQNNRQTTRNLSNKELVNNPDQCKFEDALRALCQVVSELVEIEEQRQYLEECDREDRRLRDE